MIVLAAIGYGIGGYRNGALIGASSLLGFFGGAVLGAQFARPLGSRLAHGQAQVPVAIVCVLMTALIGQLLGIWIAGRLREAIRWRPAQRVDSGVGAAFGVLAVLLVAWMIAVPLASSPYPSLVSAVRRSAVVRSVDAVIPREVRTLYSSLRRYIDRSGFPPVFGALQSTRIVDVAAPDPALVNSPKVVQAQSATFKILANATHACHRGTAGSGFVYAPHHMLTNAHVVAGADANSVYVEYAPHRQTTATVVLFDPQEDVAVLYLPTLPATAMPLPLAHAPVKTGANAIVLGYPKAGQFTAQAARVRDSDKISGPDIYGDGTLERDIYTIRSVVRGGNSGGPFISTAGDVLGVVFGAALDSSDTGFVLTATSQQLRNDATNGETATRPVSTRTCT